MGSNRSPSPNIKNLQSASMKTSVEKGKYLVLVKKESVDSTPPGNSKLSASERNELRLYLLENFIGNAQLEYFSSIWTKDADWLKNQFQSYYESLKKETEENLRPLTLKDLPKAQVVPAGVIETGVLVYAKDPSEFFIVLENTSYYGLEKSEWNTVFDAFKTGPEAFGGIQALLNVFYTSYETLELGSKDAFGSPEVGTLVAIKFLQKPAQDSDEKENPLFQFRRGVVTATSFDRESQSTVFTVYLLDFGSEATVTEYFLHPLLKPFNLIAPLALRCGMFGISPAGAYWSADIADYFKARLIQYRDDILSFEFCSFVTESIDTSNLPSTVSYLVSMDVRRMNLKTKSIECLFNFTELLIKDGFGIPWNLTPTRPKIMKGTTVATLVERPDKLPKVGRCTLPFRTALLLTPHHPRMYYPLPEPIINRELQRLFSLRGHALGDVNGMRNRLVMELPDVTKRMGSPSSVSSAYDKAVMALEEQLKQGKGGDEEKEGEREEENAGDQENGKSGEREEEKAGEQEEEQSGEQEEENAGDQENGKSGEQEEENAGDQENGKSGEQEEKKSGEQEEENAGDQENGKSGEQEEEKSGEQEEKKSGEQEEENAGDQENGKSGEQEEEKSGEQEEEKAGEREEEGATNN